MTQQNDGNPEETKEWLDAFHSVLDEEGIDRAQYLLDRLADQASIEGVVSSAGSVNTPYRNTISPTNEERMPGDMFMEREIRGIIRWNALAMVMAPMSAIPVSGGTSPPSRPLLRSMMWVLTTFFVARMRKTKAISSIFRGIHLRVFMRAPI